MRIELPTSWDGITVGKFQELYPVLESDGKLVERVPAMISVLSGVPLEDVKKISLNDYKTISKSLKFLDELETLRDIKDDFKVGKVKYAIDLDINNMSGAQYMDFMHFLNECKGESSLVMRNLHNLLSCVIIEKKRKGFKWIKGEYDGSTIEERRKLIKEVMPISLAFPIAVFFWNLWEQLTRDMEDYGKNKLKKAKRIMEEVETDLLKYGAGMSHLTT